LLGEFAPQNEEDSMSTLRALFMLMALALPAGAWAQQTDSGPQPYRKWDVGGGVGIRFGQTDDEVVPAGSWNAQITRYWTAHVMTSFNLMTAGQTTYAGPYPSVLFVSQRTITDPAAYSATAGYQFFDNEFVQPYIVGGARFASSATTTTIYSERPPYTSSSVTSPSTLLARPVVGGGFKSYFGNGRAFMRSELLMAITPHGSPHAVLTIGAGVDF
jgi:hypothetical protein